MKTKFSLCKCIVFPRAINVVVLVPYISTPFLTQEGNLELE